MIRENFEDLAKLLALMANKNYIDAYGNFTEEGKSYVRGRRGTAYVQFIDSNYPNPGHNPSAILEQLERLKSNGKNPCFWLCEEMSNRRNPTFRWHGLRDQEDCSSYIRKTVQYFDLVRQFDSMTVSPSWDEINDMDIL